MLIGGNTLESDYRPISSLALLALILGTFSFGAFAFPALAIAGFFGLLAGVVSILQIRRNHLHGISLAIAALVCATLGTSTSISYHLHLYHAEAAEGAIRVDFAEAMIANRHGLDTYAGKLICVKGYPVRKHLEMKWEPTEINLSYDGSSQTLELTIPVDCSIDLDKRMTPLAISGYLEVDYSQQEPSKRYRLVNSICRRGSTRFQISRLNSKNAC